MKQREEKPEKEEDNDDTTLLIPVNSGSSCICSKYFFNALELS